MARMKLGTGARYCTFCGSRAEKNAEVCPACGRSYGVGKYNGIEQIGAGGIGYSANADDPSFRLNKSRNAKAGFIFLIILSVIIAAVLVITQHVSLANAAIVVGVIWVFDIIWFLSGLRKKKDWEGIVESKKSYIEERRGSSSDDTAGYTHVYKLVFRTADGKKKTLKDQNNSRRFDYFREGDRLRYIGSLGYYEKYDKSQDPFIPCAGCSSERDARENYCGRCGCIILKGDREKAL